MSKWDAADAWGRENHRRLALALDNLVDALIEADMDHEKAIDWRNPLLGRLKQNLDESIALLAEQGAA